MSLPQLTGYRIERPLASGGMAKIYSGIQLSLNRPVAIKFLSRPLLEHSEAKELFDAESLIIAKLNHPNIVQVIDRGTSEDGLPYFVMEKINGIDLGKMLEQGQLPFHKRLDIAIQASKGLAYAHKNGVIHRDIKPSNIIIDQLGNAKILDFGIALSASSLVANGGSSVVGTKGYAAPEQLNDSAQATFASDVYSMGVVFFDLFGKPVEDAERTNPDRLDKQLPEALRHLLVKCVSEDPANRFQSLAEVRDELLRISQGSHLDQSNIDEAEEQNQHLSHQFNLLDVLSRRKDKKVYLFQKKSNQQLFVIKHLIDETRGLKQAKLLMSLRHPNIVRIFAAAKKNGSLTIISEYMPGGSLDAQLIAGFSEQKFLVVACQICSAIAFAHQNNIRHLNLSPNNIHFDSHGNVKLADFGQPTQVNDHPDKLHYYQPPATQSYSEQYDIYAMGAIFHHMLLGYPPGAKPVTPRKKITYRIEKLIDAMLAENPQDRPQSAQQILIELQRIAAKDNPRHRSSIGKAIEEKPVSVKKKNKSQSQNKQATNPVNLWLVFALILSLGVITGLLIRDFL